MLCGTDQVWARQQLSGTGWLVEPTPDSAVKQGCVQEDVGDVLHHCQGLAFGLKQRIPEKDGYEAFFYIMG